ncbi:monofunctional biosynthetic peptidoglycan transglycosylase [Oceaniglobus ichthyenteri]|uniref:monofunctional biosynthetic peptidoglycan transglycosylase n=1 Tax=Oceaniglobus ichthyenteri TaxID=2136177 RepID=UPI001F0BAFD5|nr:monofunctional biosynthetic peptidoglycan transglycosylase [Oceaniglobus ichthyenteri]
MARSKPSKKAQAKAPRQFRPVRWLLRWAFRIGVVALSLGLIWISWFAVFNPGSTPYMRDERKRLGAVDYQWVSMADIAPVMARSAVAAEDANFCAHWGFDMAAIRLALENGGARGASTISQQVVKNLFLWQGRSWTRKALEAGITPIVETLWSKRRILEVYLNIAEFDQGVFGVDAAAHHYFGVTPAKLSATQAARLAAILPNPKERSASKPSNFVRTRSNSIRDGAATIDRDGRAACFQQ